MGIVTASLMTCFDFIQWRILCFNDLCVYSSTLTVLWPYAIPVSHGNSTDHSLRPCCLELRSMVCGPCHRTLSSIKHRTSAEPFRHSFSYNSFFLRFNCSWRFVYKKPWNVIFSVYCTPLQGCASVPIHFRMSICWFGGDNNMQRLSRGTLAWDQVTN